MDYRSNKNLPRGMRANNPLNIRKSAQMWQGKTSGNDTAFETFENVFYGLRAGAKIVLNDMRKGKTLEQIISEYAPPAENKTGVYIGFVSKVTGFAPDICPDITPLNVAKIVKAMVAMESGANAAAMIDEAEYIRAVNSLFKPAAKQPADEKKKDL